MKSRRNVRTNRRKFRATKSKVYRKSRRNARKIMRGGALEYPYDYTNTELATALNDYNGFYQKAFATKYLKPLLRERFNINDWSSDTKKTDTENIKMLEDNFSKYELNVLINNDEPLILELQKGKLTPRDPPGKQVRRIDSEGYLTDSRGNRVFDN